MMSPQFGDQLNLLKIFLMEDACNKNQEFWFRDKICQLENNDANVLHLFYLVSAGCRFWSIKGV